jgi:hypothetical protein
MMCTPGPGRQDWPLSQGTQSHLLVANFANPKNLGYLGRLFGWHSHMVSSRACSPSRTSFLRLAGEFPYFPGVDPLSTQFYYTVPKLLFRTEYRFPLILNGFRLPHFD